jgi:WXG100 family type VII secretion target
MEQTAARFDHISDSLQVMLKRLLGELEVLQSAWVGAGGTSFQQVKQAWAADQAALQRALAQTADAMRSAGRHYTAADEAAAVRFTTSRGRPALPL